MAPQHTHARVIRAYTLPVHAFDHLKGYQRVSQHQANVSGDGRTVTNSEALCNILQDHANIALAAMSSGLAVREFCQALAAGGLVVNKPATTAGGSHACCV
mgnify:CR=1 FL=1